MASAIATSSASWGWPVRMVAAASRMGLSPIIIAAAKAKWCLFYGVYVIGVRRLGIGVSAPKRGQLVELRSG